MHDRQFSTNMEFHHYLQRAKVYKLNDEGKWDDKGTGHVAVEYLERSETVGLVVLDEEDNKTLLLHRISADDIYRRTEEHIIAWTDPEVATNLALSFQDTMGCSYIWDQICSVQRSVHFPAVGALDVGPRSANEVLEHLGTSQSNDGVSNELLDLPAVELSSLPEIAKILTDASVSFLDRDQIGSLIIKDPNFLRKLVELFSLYEDLENIEGLHLLFKIAKAIISLNDGHTLDIILSDKYIMDIIGMLEYDPDVAVRQNHRAFLKEHVMFKQVVPIEDSAVLAKIHQTYKIGYIKDVIMPNVLDNQTFGSMNTMILANNVSVVSTLLHNKSFIKNLFTELKSPRLSKQAKKDLVHFLQEFCSLTNLQQHSRMLLFDALVREGLLDVVTDVLGSDDESLRLSGTDILIVVLNFDSTILRKFLIHQPGNTLFSCLVTGMLTPGQGGAQAQLLEVMRMVLDCEVTDRLPPEMSSFLDLFYGKYMDQILDVLVAGTSSKGASNLKQKCGSQRGPTERPRHVSPEILGNICELLCFCVQHHANRIKYYILRKQVIEKVLKLTTRREKYLVVAAVRFLRTCVGRKDEFYYGCIVKQDLFEPLIQAFLVNGSRYNLLNSAFLELIEVIVKENIKSLIGYLIEKYNDKFENIHYVDTFKRLKLKYDQGLEGMLTREQDSGAVRSKEKGMYSRDRLDGFPDTARRRKDDRALDKDEEEYFNEDSDDEEDTASVQTTVSTGKLAQAVIVNGGPLSALVDYEDEDEEPPTLVRNNGSDRESESRADGLVSSPSCSNKEPSVWLDREEDKMIQNLKRKSLSTSSAEADIELQKRRRSSMEPVHPTEEEVRPENPSDRNNKPETSSRQVEKSLSTSRVERSCLNCTEKDSKSTMGKTVCTLSNAESGGAADSEIVNKGSDMLSSGTNGTGSLVEIHGVAGS